MSNSTTATAARYLAKTLLSCGRTGRDWGNRASTTAVASPPLPLSLVHQCLARVVSHQLLAVTGSDHIAYCRPPDTAQVLCARIPNNSGAEVTCLREGGSVLGLCGMYGVTVMRSSTPRVPLASYSAAMTGEVLCTAVSRDGSTVVCGGVATDVSVWAPPSPNCLGTLSGHADWVRSVAFLYLAPQYDSVRDTLRGMASASVPTPITSPTFLGTAADRRIDGGDRTPIILSPTRPGRAPTFASPPLQLPSPDAEYLVSGSDDGTVNLWHCPSRRIIRQWNVRVVHELSVTTLGPSAHGVRSDTWQPSVIVAVGSEGDEGVALFDPVHVDGAHPMGHLRRKSSCAVTAIGFASDGHWVAVAAEDERVILYHTLSQQPLAEFGGHSVDRMCVNLITSITALQILSVAVAASSTTAEATSPPRPESVVEDGVPPIQHAVVASVAWDGALIVTSIRFGDDAAPSQAFHVMTVTDEAAHRTQFGARMGLGAAGAAMVASVMGGVRSRRDGLMAVRSSLLSSANTAVNRLVHTMRWQGGAPTAITASPSGSPLSRRSPTMPPVDSGRTQEPGAAPPTSATEPPPPRVVQHKTDLGLGPLVGLCLLEDIAVNVARACSYDSFSSEYSQ